MVHFSAAATIITALIVACVLDKPFFILVPLARYFALRLSGARTTSTSLDVVTDIVTIPSEFRNHEARLENDDKDILIVVLGCGFDFTSRKPSPQLRSRLEMALNYTCNGLLTNNKNKTRLALLKPGDHNDEQKNENWLLHTPAESSFAPISIVMSGGHPIDPASKSVVLLENFGLELPTATRLPISEASIMTKWITHFVKQISSEETFERSCQPFKIFQESNSTSTRSNAIKVLQAIKDGVFALSDYDGNVRIDNRLLQIIVVTNGFHRWRALRTFRMAASELKLGPFVSVKVASLIKNESEAEEVYNVGRSMWIREAAATMLYGWKGWL